MKNQSKSRLKTFLAVGAVAFVLGLFLYFNTKGKNVDAQNIEIAQNAVNRQQKVD